MEATLRSQTSDKTMAELGAAVREGEHLLQSTPADGTEKTREIRAKLQAALDKAKGLYEQVQEKTVAAAKATDQTIRTHPYQAIGVAFGIGLAVGLLCMRRNRD